MSRGAPYLEAPISVQLLRCAYAVDLFSRLTLAACTDDRHCSVLLFVRTDDPQCTLLISQYAAPAGQPAGCARESRSAQQRPTPSRACSDVLEPRRTKQCATGARCSEVPRPFTRGGGLPARTVLAALTSTRAQGVPSVPMLQEHAWHSRIHADPMQQLRSALFLHLLHFRVCHYHSGCLPSAACRSNW